VELKHPRNLTPVEKFRNAVQRLAVLNLSRKRRGFSDLLFSLQSMQDEKNKKPLGEIETLILEGNFDEMLSDDLIDEYRGKSISEFSF